MPTKPSLGTSNRPDFPALATHRGRESRALILVRADGLAYSERGWAMKVPDAKAIGQTLRWHDGVSEPLEQVASDAELRARGL